MERRIKHHPRSEIAEAFGWVGAFVVLGSYFLLSFGLIDGSSIVYHSMVFSGSLALAVITYRHKAFQSLVTNLTFALLALLAILRLTLFA